MNEATPIPKPPLKVGGFDWNRAPDSLFSNAFNLISKAKLNPVTNEALQIVMNLKRKEAIIMAQQMMVEHEQEYLKEHQEDAMFTRKGLANNKKRLNRFTREKAELMKEYEKRMSHNPSLKFAYGEVAKNFDQMLDLIALQRQEMEIGAQASYQSDLLKLLDFYLKSG